VWRVVLGFGVTGTNVKDVTSLVWPVQGGIRIEASRLWTL
jgi:hypothetical protein